MRIFDSKINATKLSLKFPESEKQKFFGISFQNKSSFRSVWILFFKCKRTEKRDFDKNKNILYSVFE
jgi:hypothetical protein